MLSKISSATPWWVLCVEVCCGVEVGLGKNTKSIWPKYKVKYKVLSYVFLRRCRFSTRILNAKGKYLCLPTPLRSITPPSPNTPSLGEGARTATPYQVTQLLNCIISCGSCSNYKCSSGKDLQPSEVSSRQLGRVDWRNPYPWRFALMERTNVYDWCIIHARGWYIYMFTSFIGGSGMSSTTYLHLIMVL